MTYTVRQICDFMENWAPPELAYSWDKIGLQTGAQSHNVTAVLVCLTVTPEALKAAHNMRADMIVAHHPLIWNPLTHLRDDDPQTKLSLNVAASGMACFVAHTNLDIADGGVNDALADRLGLIDCKPLFPADHVTQIKLTTFVPGDHADRLRDALAAAGAGVIGDYTHCSFQCPGTGTFMPNDQATPFSGCKGRLNKEEEVRIEMLLDRPRLRAVVEALYNTHPYEEPAYDLFPLVNHRKSLGLGRYGTLPEPMRLDKFTAFVRKSLNLAYVQQYGSPHKIVRTVGVLGGSGGKFIESLPPSVDVYISGDIGYHEALGAALQGAACIDAGHAGTEIPVLEVIQKRLKHAFIGIPVKIFREKPLGIVPS